MSKYLVLVNGIERQATDQEVLEIEARNAAYLAGAGKRAADEARSKRDKILSESDWVTVKAVDQNAQDSLGIQVPQVWLDYRQALRDITNHANFPNLEEADWPVKP